MAQSTSEAKGGDGQGDVTGLLGMAVERHPLPAAGKSGAKLEALRLLDGRTFVLKHVEAGCDWIMRATGDTGRMGRLWSSGALAQVPATIDHSVVSVSPVGSGWRVLMRDVSEALFPDGRRLSRTESRRILAAAADLHAAFQDGSRPDGLAPLAELYRFLSPAMARQFSGDAQVPRLAVRGWERFAELVSRDVAAGVARVHERPESLAERLTHHRCTLVHGDLKLANLGFAGDRVVILDWGSLTTWAPAAVDYAWFLAINAASIDATHDELLEDIRGAAASDHDEDALQLALLGALAQLGWEKALGATEAEDEAVRRRECDGLGWWAGRAREALEVLARG